ncbi:MAG: D-alanine--D-alanine ligase A [Rhizobiales bacterium 65-9]|nr:D-alanine--D-alanine ligase [Hyphomicrobiales bacterium]OJY35622.1 MAG: D-alanine--D-alanine ligase A [Rhizobiales bacterium 65-9]
MTRLRVAVLFGGRSAEHDVSILSARNVVKGLDPAKYDIVPIFITRDGRWRLIELENGVLPEAFPEHGAEVCLMPGGRGRLLAFDEESGARSLAVIGILFPVLHGMDGEDGSVQGLAAVAGVPLAGCGLLGSATAIDKDMAKRLLREAGLPVARSLTLHRGETVSFKDAAARLGSPVFVKPARQGSSVGVSKAATAGEFPAAVEEAFRHDAKILIEEFVQGREIECSVLERADGSLFVSLPGEIAAAESHGFYSYDAKYIDPDGAVLSIPAQLSDDATQRVRALAEKAFRALGCDSVARVDFFARPDASFVVNEINTIPGFTDISMYAKALAASGVAYRDVLDDIIAYGLERARRQSA